MLFAGLATKSATPLAGNVLSGHVCADSTFLSEGICFVSILSWRNHEMECKLSETGLGIVAMRRPRDVARSSLT